MINSYFGLAVACRTYFYREQQQEEAIPPFGRNEMGEGDKIDLPQGSSSPIARSSGLMSDEDR